MKYCKVDIKHEEGYCSHTNGIRLGKGGKCMMFEWNGEPKYQENGLREK